MDHLSLCVQVNHFSITFQTLVSAAEKIDQISRVIVVLSIGDKIFSDDQSKFSCDTSIPGCSNIFGS